MSPRDQKAYDYLRQRLAGGELTPGTILREASLAEEIGMSRTPVREALGRLRAEGVVEVVPRFGWLVRMPSRQEVSDLYESREMLECFTVQKVAEQRSPDDVEKLGDLVGAMEAIVASWNADPSRQLSREESRQCAQYDSEFHELILKLSGNAWLQRLGLQMGLLTRVFAFKAALSESLDRDPSPVVASPESPFQLGAIWEQSVRDHHDIWRAIEQQDVDRARRVMSLHIRAGLQTSLRCLESRNWSSAETLSAAASLANQQSLEKKQLGS